MNEKPIGRILFIDFQEHNNKHKVTIKRFEDGKIGQVIVEEPFFQKSVNLPHEARTKKDV